MAEEQSNKFVINYLTDEQYASALAAGTINDNDFYCTPDIEAGSGVSSESSIFYWDGLSSTANPDNIAFWQEIVDKSIEKDVYILAIEDYRKGPRIFSIKKGDVTTTTTNLCLDGLVYSINVQRNVNKGAYVQESYPSVELRFSQGVVTSVSAILSYGYTPQSMAYYLPSQGTDIAEYTPTYDYHPATKKYVDDAILGALGGSY